MLHSERFISGRTMKKMDRISNSMAENGLYQFYNSYTAFQKTHYKDSAFQNVIIDAYNQVEDITPLTFQHFKRVVVFILFLHAVAFVIFLAEILIFSWKKWRDRKYTV